jgi:toxin-antitoxin system PIN domain toxin
VILPDVNVLLEAFRPDAKTHRECRQWLDDVVNGPSAYGMSPQVLSSVVRILTNRRALNPPQSLDTVLTFCNRLMEPPSSHMILPGPRHWGIFSDLCRDVGATGNLVPDAWFAALAIESGCEWITLDRDFARFPRLRWRTPF